MKKYILFITIVLAGAVFSQEKKEKEVNLWEGEVKSEFLEEIIFIPISKKEIKKIVKKISNSLNKNYKKNDALFFDYEERIIANDSIENNLTGKFGTVIPKYSDINISDIEYTKVYQIRKSRIVGTAQAINAASTPFIVPSMGFVLPIISIEDSPFIQDISDYVYSGWSDDYYYIINFEPKKYDEEYKFCGKVIINKEDFAVINIKYSLCSIDNITKVKDVPYVSNKLSFKYKLYMRTVLLFTRYARRFSNNLYGETLYWETDIGYKKKDNKYTLDYLTISSSSKVIGKMENKIAKKIHDKEVQKKILEKKKIDVLQTYKLNLKVSEEPYIEVDEDQKNMYMDAIFYNFYNSLEQKKRGDDGNKWRANLYKSFLELDKNLYTK